jgi:hypothetical protein
MCFSALCSPAFSLYDLTAEWSQILHVRKTTTNIILLFVSVMTNSYARGIKMKYFEMNASAHNQKWLLRSSCLQNFIFSFIWRYSITIRHHTERYIQISCVHFVSILHQKILFSKHTHSQKTYCLAECTDPIRHARILCVIQDHIMLGVLCVIHGFYV